MPAGLVYQMTFSDVSGGVSQTNIYDTQAPDADVTQIISLTPASDPIKVGTIDNSEDKFTPIRSQQLTITFLSDVGISLEQFADGPDDRFLVESYYNGNVIFRGFLSLADNSEAFMPGRNEVTLTASDKLGALKEIALVDFDGINPQGKYRIIEIIAMALRLTGQSLNINVIHNLKPGGGSISTTATFIGGGTQAIAVSPDFSSFFYIGQNIRVTDSALNNGDYTVLGFDTLGAFFVIVDTPLTNEASNPVTITDLLSDRHIYDQCYLDVRTFEDEIGVSEDAYTVLEKILGFDCSLFYWAGSWWIYRVNEREGSSLRWASYSDTGEFLGYIEGSFNQLIGLNESNWLANAATEWTPSREIGEVKLTLEYDYPEELICNQDLGRGNAITPYTGIGIEEVKYNPECIEYLREGSPSTFANLDQPKDPAAEGVLIKNFEGSVENERYLFANIGGGFRHYFKFRPLEVGLNDKVTIGFSFRVSNPSITNIYPAVLILEGNDGSIWAWNYDQPTNVSSWVLKTASDAAFVDMFRVDLTGADAQAWTSVSAVSEPVPTDGLLYLRLVSANASYTTYFSDLSVSLKPFINGSYPNFTAQANIIKRPGNYLSKIDEEVFIGDAPIKAMKGAIFIMNDLGRFVLLNVFTENGVAQRFGWHQVQAVWNQYRNAVRVFQYDLVAGTEYLPHLIHRYQITDAHGATVNRYFIMITFEMNLKINQMTGTLPEVYRTDLGKVYTDPFTFKYVTK